MKTTDGGHGRRLKTMAREMALHIREMQGVAKVLKRGDWTFYEGGYQAWMKAELAGAPRPPKRPLSPAELDRVRRLLDAEQTRLVVLRGMVDDELKVRKAEVASHA